MKNYYWILTIFIICNCNSDPDNKNTNKVDSAEGQSTTDIHDLSYDENDQTSLLKEEQGFSIDTCKSPAGLVIEVWGPSDIEGVLYFYSNNKIVSKYYDTEILVGEWILEDSIVEISYSKRIYKRGIGEPIPLKGAVPGNYVEQYKSYEEAIEEIDKDTWHYWTEIKECIKENIEYTYTLKSYELDENSFDINTKLNL